MRFLSTSTHSHDSVDRSTPVWVLVAALAGLVAAIVISRQHRRAAGIDPLRDRWHGEGPQPVDERAAIAS